MTTFQLVSMMNTAFQNPKGDPLNIDWQRIEKQCLNIPDEVGELFKALGGHTKDSEADMFIKKAVTDFKAALVESLNIGGDNFNEVDVIGVRDALCDIPVFATGAQHLMGVDGDRDMESVIDGVMSRFIKNDEDREATSAKHAANGITEVYFEGEYPNMVMKSAIDQPDAPKGKFLKSASFVEAVFYDLEAEAEQAASNDADNEECGECDQPIEDCTCEPDDCEDCGNADCTCDEGTEKCGDCEEYIENCECEESSDVSPSKPDATDEEKDW